MGTWGVNSFENDAALDWTDGLERKSDLTYIEATLDRVLGRGTGYLEAPDAQEAIAAAEAVALKPDFQLAKNNLAWARQQKAIGATAAY